MKTPLLFLIFNRPEATAQVFAEIRKARPEKLFIAADGPRPDRPDDIEKCRLTREAVSNIDWPCEVKTLFQEKNLGCKIGATTGITWFFDNVEEGIVLEDDCLPDQSYFPFCTELLERFRHNENISMISGCNESQTTPSPYSYIYSRYGHLWGWASWRRVWKQYDVTMKHWAPRANQRAIKKAMHDRKMWNYRVWHYIETYEGRKDTWDYQWETYRLLHGQLAVIPTKNMIHNLGFGPEATHTVQTSSYLIMPRQQTEFPLRHNPDIRPHDAYDRTLRPRSKAFNIHVRRFRARVRQLLQSILPARASSFLVKTFGS
ncbi:MAG: glycosyltransferase family 2 protein [Patescibacteria group bacterium]